MSRTSMQNVIVSFPAPVAKARMGLPGKELVDYLAKAAMAL